MKKMLLLVLFLGVFFPAAPAVARSRGVTIINTQCLVGGGVTLGLVF